MVSMMRTKAAGERNYRAACACTETPAPFDSLLYNLRESDKKTILPTTIWNSSICSVFGCQLAKKPMQNT